MEVYLPFLKESCAHFKLMRNFLIFWIAAMLHWQYFIKGSNFLSHHLRQLLELALTSANFIDHLDFRMFIFGSHSRNQDEFTVSFISRRKFIFLFSRKLFEFWAYSNFLDHLDCSHGALAVLYLRKLISLPSNEGSCLNSPFQVLISLTIWFLIVNLWFT